MKENMRRVEDISKMNIKFDIKVTCDLIKILLFSKPLTTTATNIFMKISILRYDVILHRINVDIHMMKK